jgi:hypothetical protein
MCKFSSKPNPLSHTLIHTLKPNLAVWLGTTIVVSLLDKKMSTPQRSMQHRKVRNLDGFSMLYGH